MTAALSASGPAVETATRSPEGVGTRALGPGPAGAGLRVCFVSHSAQLYGAERCLLELIESLRARGVRPHVILPAAGPLQARLRAGGVPCAVIPFRSWMSRPSPPWKAALRLASIPLSSLALAMLIRRWRCDAVLSNTLSVCEGALAARITGLPHVWAIHELEYEAHGLVFHLGERRSLALVERFSSCCTACSEAVARRYEPSLGTERVKVVYPSVTLWTGDPSTAPPSRGPRARMRCVMVGALTEGKRQEDAILAVAHLLRSGIDIELVLVGSGDREYEARVRRLVRAHGLDERVTLAGYMDNPVAVVQAATVLLVCSTSEAFGRVAVEAMLLEKPVIGTRRGGMRELIRDGFNGLLYSPGDVQALADRIRYVHEHPEAAQAMGRNGRRWALARFSQDRYGAEMLSLLRQITGGGPGDAVPDARGLNRSRRPMRSTVPAGEAPVFPR